MKINKIILTMAIFVLLLPLAYADFCDLRGVLYYGDCNKEGDVKVLDEQDNEIAINLYSENSGCYNGVYKIVVSGGPSAGCILQENEIITFYLGGKLAGATKWSSTHLNREFELSAERVVYDVEAPDIIVTDEQGADVSTHGAGGGGGSGSGTRIFFATKQTDSGDVEIGKFDIPLDNEDSIEIQAPESGEVYLNVSGAQDTEILVPAMQEKGSVVVCIGSKSFFTCDKKLKLEMGSSSDGITLLSDYKVVNGQKYYVLQGLKTGTAKEDTGILRTILVSILIVAAVSLLVMYIIVRKR